MGVTTLRWLATSLSSNERSVDDEIEEEDFITPDEEDMPDDYDDEGEDEEEEYEEEEKNDEDEDEAVGIILDNYDEEIGHLFEDGGICLWNREEETELSDFSGEAQEDDLGVVEIEPMDQGGEFVCYDFDDIPSMYSHLRYHSWYD